MANKSSKKSNHQNQSQPIASCYVVEAGLTAVSGLQYGSTVAGGAKCPAYDAALKEHLAGQALTVAKLCERELCEVLRATFLGERKLPIQDSLATAVAGNSYKTRARLEAYIEILDYIGGNDFRGFVARKGTERGLFIFFGQELLHKELKTGIVAILELASYNSMDITQVVACLDRKMSEDDLQSLTRDLGWVGFEMATLAPWTDGILTTSEEWLLLAMET